MKKSIIYLLSICTCFGILSSCEDDEKYVPVPPKVTITSLNGEFTVMQEDTLFLKASIESPLPAIIELVDERRRSFYGYQLCIFHG